ncbi:MAG: hypothetical protein IJT58_05120 [Synergistaceae bacterium]|nr:hypothetical protein [Synergistaceae bacterium]
MTDKDNIVNDVRGWLEGTDIEIINLSQADNKFLNLELRGEPVQELAKNYGKDGRLILHWLLPDFENNLCVIQDFLTGEKYLSGYVFRRPEFLKHGSISPLHLSPDLEKGKVYPAWYYDVEFKWKKFANSVINNESKKCFLNNFIALEAGLNAVFTSSSARRAARFVRKEGTNSNPLSSLEAKRQVLISWTSETLGRLRIPHGSHKYRLCPFETPEAKLAGLQLNLAANAEPKDGKIIPGGELLSIAAGLIPYPNHTDGYGLISGVKNMKQAESKIIGSEAPIVPGYYEGNYSSKIKIKPLRGHLKDKRFFPYLGLNALTVIMPFEGCTYGDGLVISESLAERLYIRESHHRITKSFDVLIKYSELEAHSISIEDWSGIFDCDSKKYVYGDKLPEPVIKFYDESESEKPWHEIYNHHAPGVLTGIKVRHVIKKEAGSKRSETKNYRVELTVSWLFSVERPMGLGDKLTGRSGNKGVVTKILPDYKMPLIHFAKESRHAELIISPCSITRHKNLGQIWEMMHSLLIKEGGVKLHDCIEANGIDINNIRLDEVPEILGRLDEFLQETGCTESGAFRVTYQGQEFRAFAGWQYFCRLIHHSWEKLQARGVNAPHDTATGQPVRCGALTGQRLGEMENWSLLSHGAFDVLQAMRETQTGDYGKTRRLFKKILRSLGIVVTESASGLDFAVRDEHDDWKLEKRGLRQGLGCLVLYPDMSGDFVSDSPFCAIIDNDTTCKAQSEILLAELRKFSESKEIKGYGKDYISRVNAAIKKLDDLINDGAFFNGDGSIHIEPDIMSYSADLSSGVQEAGSVTVTKHKLLRDLLLQFAINGYELYRVEALIAYRDGLIELLSRKNGLPRYYMSGRRYNHSGRAVIVPEPSLRVDSVYLPAAMLIELLDDYDDSYISRIPEELKDTRRIFNDFYNRRAESESLAEKLDDFMNSPEGELWCFMVRQPSLHRHRVMAFRVRCWAFPVIGIAPFVTQGFNADFDGCTMSVFLPPYSHARDLSRFSLINNPGLVGNGRPAFADSLDLALGFWKMTHKSLSEHIAGLLRDFQGEQLISELQNLQIEITKSSTGAATLTPYEFEHLLLQDSALLKSGAGVSINDVDQMTKSIGEIDTMQDSDGEVIEKKIISGNFWQGLNEEELFTYSYQSRYSMAQKRLSVSEAGYLSRQLAEKLFECTISRYDCGTKHGLEISYSHKDGRLLINGVEFPSQDFERVLWGRVLLGESHCMSTEDVKALIEKLKAGRKVIMRSPVYCKERESGHICSLCYGADTALKPFDRPEAVYVNFAAGLTAAQAIGERGTQAGSESPMKLLKKLIISSKESPIKKIKAVIENLHGNQELSQSLIHFETAAAYKESGKDNYLSKFTDEGLSRILIRNPGEGFNFRDDLSTLKSRLLWS